MLAAARLLRSWVRIPPGVWIFVYCECRVLSGRGLCDELIIRPEESYRLWCVVVCDLETSRIDAPCIYIYDISSLRVKACLNCFMRGFAQVKVKICNGTACDETLTCAYCSHCLYRRILYCSCCYLLSTELEWSITLCGVCRNGSPATLHMICVVHVIMGHLQHCTCSVLCTS